MGRELQKALFNFVVLGSTFLCELLGSRLLNFVSTLEGIVEEEHLFIQFKKKLELFKKKSAGQIDPHPVDLGLKFPVVFRYQKHFRYKQCYQQTLNCCDSGRSDGYTF